MLSVFILAILVIALLAFLWYGWKNHKFSEHYGIYWIANVYRPAMKQASFISSRVPMQIYFTRKWSLISTMTRKTARDIPYRTPGLLLLSKNKIRKGLQESWSN